MSYNSTHGSYTANTAGDRLYPIHIQIQNAFGGWTNVTAISDTGNEISIFKKEVMDELGLNPHHAKEFKVAGINGPPRVFKMFNLWVKIGTLHPINIRIGFAPNHGDLADNLLGNQDILKSGKFEVVYGKDHVTYTQKALSAKVASGSNHYSEQEVLNNMYDHLSTIKYRKLNKEAGRDGGGRNSISMHYS